VGERLTLFRPAFNRAIRVEARPERLTTDPEAVLLQEIMERLGIVSWLTKRITNPRHPELAGGGGPHCPGGLPVHPGAGGPGGGELVSGGCSAPGRRLSRGGAAFWARGPGDPVRSPDPQQPCAQPDGEATLKAASRPATSAALQLVPRDHLPSGSRSRPRAGGAGSPGTSGRAISAPLLADRQLDSGAAGCRGPAGALPAAGHASGS